MLILIPGYKNLDMLSIEDAEDLESKEVINYVLKLKDGLINSGIINLAIGDLVRTSNGDIKKVINIEGTKVITQSTNSTNPIEESIDVSQTDLFKIDEQSIECVNPIIIKYGR